MMNKPTKEDLENELTALLRCFDRDDVEERRYYRHGIYGVNVSIARGQAERIREKLKALRRKS